MKVTERKINWINSATNELHDEVASINEDFVDGDLKATRERLETLIEKAKVLLTNIDKDEV